MRSFLRLINYLSCFSPRLAELSNPLREICRQKVKFQLTRACEIAFQHCKEEISKNTTLPYYNPKSPTILQTDASKRGFGAVLLQNSTLVMFASRALTRSEKNYQNLERESVLQLFGEWKHSTISSMGRNLLRRQTRNCLCQSTRSTWWKFLSRIQRLVVRSFPYQPFNVRYRKGVEIPLADALSRVTPLPMEEDGIQLPIIAVNQVTANIPYSSNELDQICEETRKYPTASTRGPPVAGTTGKIYLSRMDLQPRVPDFSFLPPFEGKS